MTPQHWRLVHSYNELLDEISRLPLVGEIFHFLEFQIERYHEVSHHWRSVTCPIEGPLPRSRTAEFALILDCEDHYDALDDKAYVLNHTRPRRHGALTLTAEGRQLPMSSQRSGWRGKGS